MDPMKDEKISHGMNVSPEIQRVLSPASVGGGKIDVDMDGKNLDVAATYLHSVGDMPYTQREEKALRWRLDKRLVPLLFLNVTLGAVDKSTISTGALYNLKTDTDMLVGSRYAWAGSAFYFGYLLWCFPAGSILQKFPIAKTMMVFQIMWGLVLIGTGFASSFQSFVALRVLLGALEAPIVPGNFLMMGMWYTRKEQPLRTGLFYTGLSSMITGPLGYVVGFIHNQWFEPWRALFWIVGSITIVYALIIGLVLPDSPVQAKFTTEKEKYISIHRLKADQVGIQNKVWKWDQFREALLDVKTWIMVIINIFINIPNGGLGNFSTLIIKGLGYNARIASLLFMVAGITSTASCYICNGGTFFVSKYYPHLQVRGVFALFGLLVGMISTVFLYTLPLTAIHSRLTALFMSYFYLGPYVVTIGLVSANTAGYTKKITVNALIFMSYCVSNIIGPFFFLTSQAPLYTLGMGAMLFSYCSSFIMISVYMLYCWYENGRRDRLAAAGGIPPEATEFKDLTDKQNVNFRYVW